MSNTKDNRKDFYAEFQHVEQGNTITFRDYQEYQEWVSTENLMDWWVLRYRHGDPQ